MEGLQQLSRSQGVKNPKTDKNEQRRRSNRMRYFLTAFGAAHWAERIERRRIPARRGNIAL